jgi:hypothetical protein
MIGIRQVFVESKALRVIEGRRKAVDVGFVGHRRRVDGHQRDVVSAAQQLGRQRVVAQA